MIEYITLSDLVKKVSQDAVEKGKEIFNTKKIREKYINIFEMMNIDRDKLKASDCKQSKDFKIPKDSQKFLIEVYWLYSDADMKKMRKGLFEQASLESIAGLLDGFREMILKLDIPENDKDEMISKMYMRTRYPYLQRRAEVLKELENIKLDFCPDYQDDARVEDELQNYVDNNKMKEMHNISAQRRFRYFDMLDDLDVNDQLLFTSFVLEDIRCMIKRHHELYSYISEIRTCEINDAAEQKALNMTSEEEEYATVDFNYSIKLHYQTYISFNNAIMYDSAGSTPQSSMSAAQQDYAYENIHWEKTQSWDIGVDAAFFNNRLDFSADYYYKKTTDMLLSVAIPSFTGYSAPDRNVGKMHTRGWEVKLGWSDRIGDVNYAVSFNISDYKSIIDNLNGKQQFNSDGTIITEGAEYMFHS